MKEMQLTLGERDGMVVIQLPHETNEVTITPEVARELGEQIARSAHSAQYGIQSPKNKSQIAEQIRAKLLVRVSHVIRSLREQGKPDIYIANHVVDTILSETL